MGILGEYSAESIVAANRLGGLNENPECSGCNDQYDAFRHAYTSARFTEKFGVDIAKWLGDKNEEAYDPNGKHRGMTQQQYDAEKNMDLWNNNLGRQEYQNWKKATETGTTTDSLDKWVYDRVKERSTINDLIDHRSWKEHQPDGGSGGSGGADAGTEKTTLPRRSPFVPYIGGDAHTDQLSRLPAQKLIPADNTSSAVIQATPETKVRQQSHHDHQGMQEVQQGDAHNTATASVHVNHDEHDSRVLQDNQRTDFITTGENPDAIQPESNSRFAWWLAIDHCGFLMFRGSGSQNGTHVLFVRLEMKEAGALVDTDVASPAHSHSVQQSDAPWNTVVPHGFWIDTGNNFRVYIETGDYLPVHDNNYNNTVNEIRENLLLYNDNQYHKFQANGDEAHNCEDYLDYNDHGCYCELDCYCFPADCCDARSYYDDSEDAITDLRDTAWNELKIWLDASAPTNLLADSLVAFSPPTDGQMRFSSDYHLTSLAPVMTAGWQ